jgi:hypothetical protein
LGDLTDVLICATSYRADIDHDAPRKETMMNTGHTTSKIARFGRLIGQIAIGLAIALILCGVATGGVEAGKKGSYKGRISSSLTPNEYADICDRQGASDIKVTNNNSGGKTVTCSWGNDLTSSCNFQTKTCTDTFREVPTDSGVTVGDDLSVAPEPTASEPIVDSGVTSGVDPSVAPESTAPEPTAGAEPASQGAIVVTMNADVNAATTVAPADVEEQ